ncbi:hypothetical protein D3C79_1078130 [compost metagenome]
MIWNVDTCVVTPGMSVASKNAPSMRLLPLNLKRFKIYAIMEPVNVAPMMEISKIKAVFKNPVSIFPSTKALA